MDKFYLLVAGSRTYDNYKEMCEQIYKTLEQHENEEIIIVSGGAHGADRLAKIFAKNHNYEYREFLAEWDKYGKAAGYIRNSRMHEYIAQFENRACICFWDGESKGTQHNFGLAKKYKTPLKVFNYKENRNEK